MTSKKPYRIVVGIDYSSTSDLAFTRALELAAEKPHGEVHALHVVQLVLDPDVDSAALASGLVLPEAAVRLKEYLSERVAEHQASSPHRVEKCVTHVRLQSPANEIAQLASDLDASLIVVGTHGRRGVERFFLGSVAERVLRIAPCSVYVVRPEQESQVPAIAPPCPACLATRNATGGEKLWCEQHNERHGQRHTYHYESRVSQPTNFPMLLRS